MIFNLFRAKPTLKELIPRGFVDIHSHILPGIDDGAKNLEGSLLLIKKMGELGFSKIIGTPHTYPGLYNNSTQSIKKSFLKLKKELNVNVSIDYASEYMLDYYLIEKIQNNSILTLNKKYVLVELNFISAPLNYKEIIYELRLNDYIPILAHPERYRYLHNNMKFFEELINSGCVLQINLLSLIGYYGKDILSFTKKILANKMVEFVGSDIHNLKQIEHFDKKIKLSKFEELNRIINNNIEKFG